MTPNADLLEYVRGWPVHLVNQGVRFNPHVVAMGESVAAWIELPDKTVDITLGAALLAYGATRERGARGVKLSVFADAWLRRSDTADLTKPSTEDPHAESALQWAYYDKGWRVETKRHSLDDDGSVKWEEWAADLTEMIPAAPWLDAIEMVARRGPTLALADVLQAGVGAGLEYGLELVVAEVDKNDGPYRAEIARNN